VNLRSSGVTRRNVPPPDFRDIQGAADYLGTTTRHVKRLLYEQRCIEYFKVGNKVRIARAELDRYLAANKVQPA
jgi:excisionase family DNA binding protein